MPGFQPVPFGVLLRRLDHEARRENSVYGFPASRWHVPKAGLDLSVTHFGQKAANPAGPAAGPHTQLAQNIVLSWLAGARFIELKTVQVNDRLDLPKPSIRVPNVGYNIEWSQELAIEESLLEYAKAAYLVAILRSNRAFGRLPEGTPTGTIFDASLGYDLAGIRSGKVTRFLDGLKSPGPIFDALRAEVPERLAGWRDIELPETIAGTVTLSTFHGCPPGEIEEIVRYLAAERGLNVVVKLNPTLLGLDRVRELLHDGLGYTHLKLSPEAFAGDPRLEDAVATVRRLRAFAREHGKEVGVKLTNTLVVGADPGLFPGVSGPVYLSGAPLHVLAMEIAAGFRDAFGGDLPISFSAGVDSSNFADTVACGFVPVTSCTDLLKPPGYPRLGAQLAALQKEMTARGAATLGAFVRAAAAGVRELAVKVSLDPRYQSVRNSRVPVKKGGELPVWDCLDCDLCVAVCPNAAIFSFPVSETSASPYPVAARQVALVADLCNECGNCETFCPQIGSPYLTKPAVFLGRRAWEESPARDGWFRDGSSLLRRRDGKVAPVGPDDWESLLIRRDVFDSRAAGWLTPDPGEPSS